MAKLTPSGVTDAVAEEVRRTSRRLRVVGRGLVRLPGEAVRLPLQALGLVEAPVRRRQIGAMPGALPELSEEEHAPARLTVYHYDEETLDEHPDATVAEAAALKDAPGVTWVDVVGVRDMGTIAALGEAFGLHPLVQEDLVLTSQRPKLEAYGGDAEHEPQLFVIAKMIVAGPEGEGEAVRIEQVALVLGRGYLLSFQELAGDVFEPVRERLRTSAGRIRRVGPDYLAYALLDVIVDHYFVVIEGIGDRIEALEEDVMEDPSEALQAEIRRLRREALVLRRSIWPLREVISGLLRDEGGLVKEETRVFLRDAYDHTIQAVDVVESFREALSSLHDLYLSALSHRMNEVMKVLTVVGAIFIPLSFLTGLYGMNFAYIPELQYEGGYFVFLAVAVALVVGMLAYFRRRRWL